MTRDTESMAKEAMFKSEEAVKGHEDKKTTPPEMEETPKATGTGTSYVDTTRVNQDARYNLDIRSDRVSVLDAYKQESKMPTKYMAICPLDGRYAEIEERLWPYFSEYALVKARVNIEVNWLLFLTEQIGNDDCVSMQVNGEEFDRIMDIAINFNEHAFLRVKSIEDTTKHDVKAVELYVAEKLKERGLSKLVSFVHFGCTSEDITNLAYATLIRDFIDDMYAPMCQSLISQLYHFSDKYADVAMLAHTHGQPATPTTMGKEFAVFAYRLENEYDDLMRCRIMGKINGATGNYAAWKVAFPDKDWRKLSQSFVEGCLEIDFNPVTTQIESHDYTARLMDSVRHINNIIRDLDQDMWLYISKFYIKLKVVKTEVGSSTMPHKVNPIKFENSEGNVKIGNPICYAISEELPKSRLQRDLSDSTLQRNIGLAFGYSLQAIMQTMEGLGRSAVNEVAIAEDLENNWAVLAEPIQTMLRKYGVPNAYDQLKELTRGREVTKEDIHNFIDSLDMLSAMDRKTLKELTPSTYIGYAAEIARDDP